MTDSDRPLGGEFDGSWDPSGPWTREATDAFLTDSRAPIRLSCRTPGGGLWMLSLWYEFRDDALHCATAASADVIEFLDHDPGVAFEVSVNDPPYRGVRGQGQATVEPDPEKTVLRSLLQRYLGGTDSALAQRLLDKDREEVTIRIDPTRVATWDYSDRMRDVQDSDRDDPA
ncbi:pyridoxamine 5'-phosphate oxidase family protein [Halorientalis pallida]|uniref:Pyridoxamine 5'-phosphate oxidase family protein n=1 Tax=Halorientalis pallida TaxID=2479928 RepID=A0A498KSR4_9EURY|nr:pyridoxamine 5'-phosphate oxidase family protein [Halorientalis pallida]RXK46258.1 pyridoxamine 5'-phosphate oxidase family protein [Halorientalis pallida]